MLFLIAVANVVMYPFDPLVGGVLGNIGLEAEIQQGFAISTGSACSSGSEGASQVLQAIGATPDEMRRVLRVSGGWDTAAADWSGLSDAMLRVWQSLEGS